MIELKQGNLLKADAEALINTVNTKGIMGKGIALQFKKAFPEMFEEYKKACKNREVTIGKMNIFRLASLLGPKYIINFPTKINWRQPSHINYIKDGLNDLEKVLKTLNIQSIAIPPLGCGLGGLKWKEVFPLIQEISKRLPYVHFLVFPPQDSPAADKMIIRTKRPIMNLTRAKVLFILSKYCVLGYELTLLEIHKLLYFLQEAGEPLKLRFQKDAYGPYADNLRHVLHLFEGHFICGFADGRNKPNTVIRLFPDAIKDAERMIAGNIDNNIASQERLKRVVKLIEGFESPYGMELLASVHWVATRYEGIADEKSIINTIHAWNERKQKMMKPSHICLVWNRLQSQGWIY